MKTTYFVLENDEGKFLYLDWGMCDTIEGVDIVDKLEDASIMDTLDKEDVDGRKIILEEYKAHWRVVVETVSYELGDLA